MMQRYSKRRGIARFHDRQGRAEKRYMAGFKENAQIKAGTDGKYR